MASSNDRTTSPIDSFNTWLGTNLRYFLIAVFVVAFLARILVTHFTLGLNAGPQPGSDETGYVAIAMSLVHGEGYALNGVASARRPPGVPLFYAAIFSLFGETNFAALRILNIALISLTPLAVFFLGRSLNSSSVGALAALFTALLPTQVASGASLLTESAFGLMHTVTALAALSLVRSSTSWKAGLKSGIVNGLAALVRPSTLVWPIFASVPTLLKHKIRGLLIIAAVIVGTGIVLAPWTVRNQVQFGKAIVGGTNAGTLLWWSNNPSILSEPSNRGWFAEIVTPSGIALDAGGVTLKDLRSDSLGMEAGLSFLSSNWHHVPKMVWWKLGRLLTPWPTSRETWMRLIIAGTYGILLPFMILGAVTSWQKNHYDTLLVLSVLATDIFSAAIFYGTTRFRIPMEPIMMMIAAIGVSTVFEWMWSRRRRLA